MFEVSSAERPSFPVGRASGAGPTTLRGPEADGSPHFFLGLGYSPFAQTRRGTFGPRVYRVKRHAEMRDQCRYWG